MYFSLISCSLTQLALNFLITEYWKKWKILKVYIKIYMYHLIIMLMKRMTIIQYCKFYIFLFVNTGLDFTKDGKYMALAERRNCKDCISIFACSSWQLVKVLQLYMYTEISHSTDIQSAQSKCAGSQRFCRLQRNVCHLLHSKVH